MSWDDNLTFEDPSPNLALRAQYQLAMYALHLSCGHSIYCRSIKAATIEQYVFAAATLIASFSGVDFRKDSPSDKHMGHILAPVYRDLKKFESVPDRREPYDPQMHALAKRLATRFPRDSLVPALVDGFEQGYCAGYRLTEWAQSGNRSDPTKPQLNHMVSATIRTRAVVPDDFRVLTTTLQRSAGLSIIEIDLTMIAKMWVKFRTQKNGQHGEEKLFTRNPNPSGFCFVSSVFRALQRFHRLRVKDPRLSPSKTPLSVYWDPRPQCVKLIASGDIEMFMRRLAGAVYNMHPARHSADLQKWSAHSLRVGACVVLHAMGFSALDIQWILRWRSTAFMVYLRNVAILATQQYLALDRGAALPFI